MELNISPEVAAEVRRLSDVLGLSTDAVLRKALKMPERSDPSAPSMVRDAPVQWQGSRFFDCEGFPLRVGLKLRMKDKKRQVREASVRLDGILITGENKKFTSLSAAGRHLKEYPVNGWITWRFWDEERHAWRSAQELRRSY